ncbi:MAG: MBL fold metallo-hydrolase [Desulfitobacteriaceae bacterium]
MKETFTVSHLEIPTPFSIGPVNVYIVNAEPLTLIDTGLQTAEAENALNAGLNGLGYSMKDIRRVFITHGDYDHSGLARRISEVSGATVYIHPLEKLKMTGWVNFISRKADVLRAGGVPLQVLDEVIMNISLMGEVLVKELGDYTPLIGGEVIPFDGFELEVLHTPGHAPGHLCLFHREQGILLAGDTLLADITPNPQIGLDQTAQDGRLKTLKQYMHSLNILEELPINKVFTGHGRPINNIKKRIAEIKEHHCLRSKRIAEIIITYPLSPYQLALELYNELDAFNSLLGVSEVWGHLDMLQEAGVVKGWIEEGVYRFQTMV